MDKRARTESVETENTKENKTSKLSKVANLVKHATKEEGLVESLGS
jgi:hypothetical protein